MLAIRTKEGDTITVTKGDAEIRFKVFQVKSPNCVKLSIDAPKDYKIIREKLLEKGWNQNETEHNGSIVTNASVERNDDCNISSVAGWRR